MSLTADDKASLKRTFTALAEKCKNDGKDVGNEFFITMFRETPDSVGVFKAFGGKSIDELNGSKVVKEHSGKVIAKLSKMIAALDTPSDMDALMKWHGSFHKEKSIGSNYMAVGAKGINALFRKELGSAFSDSDAKAWENLFAVSAKAIDSA